MNAAPRVEPSGSDALLWIKAVPGASRSQIRGTLGDRLKVRVAAPSEDGKANKAVCALIARALGVKAARVSIESGSTSPEKVLRISDMTAAGLRQRISDLDMA